MCEWKYKSFIVSAFIGGAIWTLSFMASGYFLGDKWAIFSKLLHRYLKMISALSIIAFVIVIIFLLIRNKKADEQ
jgi:membrane protein DedA with SNARE-associated domain